MVSAGISSDLFLRNEVSSESGSLETVTVKPGKDGPFRSVYFNGISSVTVFYKLANNYLISLEPSYSQAFTDFNKDDAGFASRPRNYGLAFGFIYQFGD